MFSFWTVDLLGADQARTYVPRVHGHMSLPAADSARDLEYLPRMFEAVKIWQIY